MSGSVSTRMSAGLPLHVLNAKGAIDRSFGVEALTIIGGENDQQRMYRSIVAARDSGYWIAPATEYALEWWSQGLKRERILSRRADWFPPIAASDVFVSPLVQRPQTQLRELWQDSSGLIFANIGTAAADWRQTVSRSDDHVPVVSLQDFHKYVDTIIEVIDPNAATILATLRSPGILGQVENGPYVWSIKTTNTGRIAVDVFRMEYAK